MMDSEFQFWFNIGLTFCVVILIPLTIWAAKNAVRVHVLELEATVQREINSIQMVLINEYLKEKDFRYHSEKENQLNMKRFTEIMEAIGKLFAKLDSKADK